MKKWSNIFVSSSKSIVSTIYAVEEMESRRFRSVSYYTNDSGPGSGNFFGMILFGDNGDTSGIPTSMAGQNDDLAGAGYGQWTSNLSGGVNFSGSAAVFSLNTDSTHTAGLSLDNQNTGSFSVSSSTAIHSVEVRSSVAGSGMEFVFSNVTISFYSGNSVVETVSINDLAADTRSSTDGNPAESAAVITPTASAVTGVKVTAAFQMKVNAGVYPGITDVMGQVFVS